MQGMTYRVEGNRLIIEAELTGVANQTGKGNIMVATTGNWQRLPELGPGWSFNAVVVRKPDSPLPKKVAA